MPQCGAGWGETRHGMALSGYVGTTRPGLKIPNGKSKSPGGLTGRIEAHTRSQRIENSGPAPTEKLGAAF